MPPYPIEDLLATPFPERIRLVCRTWASQVNPNPFGVLVAYWAKYLLVFLGGWAFFCSFSAGYPGFTSLTAWAFTGVAFQKMIAWAIFYESMGLGCSSGPMNARFWPPLGGFLHWLRPGTTKLPLFPGMPIVGGTRRTWLDVGLYAAHLLFLLRALVAPEITPQLLLPTFFLIPLLGVTDKTIFLARAPSTTGSRSSASPRPMRTTCGSRPARSSGSSSGSGPRPRRSTTTSPRSSW